MGEAGGEKRDEEVLVSLCRHVTVTYPLLASRFPLPACRLSRGVPDLALEQFAVGEDDHLPRLAQHACRLEADVLNLASIVLDANRRAHYDGLVDDDRDGGEQVAKDVLNGERNRKSADSEPG